MERLEFTNVMKSDSRDFKSEARTRLNIVINSDYRSNALMFRLAQQLCQMSIENVLKCNADNGMNQ